ncbi:MAG: hypothetical protein QOG01_4080 [Pseudonocardiales bacterium]|jgi:hypothetical protein|nr:hypothetical protein [Pseudonocardiales bacterium]
MSENEAPEPQAVQFHTEAAFGASQDYGSDWIAYAVNTEAPSFVGGVDPSRNPDFGQGEDGGTAYA